jgi:hypothetical protein
MQRDRDGSAVLLEPVHDDEQTVLEADVAERNPHRAARHAVDVADLERGPAEFTVPLNAMEQILDGDQLWSRYLTAT